MSFAILVVMLTGIIVADWAWPPPIDRAQDVSKTVLSQSGEPLYIFTNDEKRWRLPVDIEEVDRAFIQNLIAIEDQRFYNHSGVDGLAILRAMGQAVANRRIVSGASTITMQTARLLEPRKRTLGAKVIEAIRAIQIERRLSKEEILSLYLTLGPYGGNIEGVRAASLLYFGKEPAWLSPAEQALLIALPQAPEARRPDLREAAAEAARNNVLQKMLNAGSISLDQCNENKKLAVPSKRYSMPKNAYHVAYALKNESNGSVVQSTINLRLQEVVEFYAAEWAPNVDDDATTSVMIVDNDTRQVVAAVGAHDRSVPGGWMDLTSALRSPGSTLKPFIYGLAFDDGALAANSVIADMPRQFGDYKPENFDRTYRGEVRVDDALKHSLNIPAVTALNEVGASRFEAALSFAGASAKRPTHSDSQAGLALALGGASLTARDLATLYSGLADKGRIHPLSWVVGKSRNDAADKSHKLLSDSAAETILSILREAPALAGRAPAALTQGATSIAYKTGTSYGYRDAWAAGVSDSHTIIVWVGRADGASRIGHTGRNTAAPLLFDLFDLVSRELAPQVTSNPVIPMKETRHDFAHRFVGAKPIEVTFPRSGTELFAHEAHPGFRLSAVNGASEYSWFVNGDPIVSVDNQRSALWHPAKAGFYEITAVDGMGMSASTRVRVRWRS